jgi:hypothetical protein
MEKTVSEKPANKWLNIPIIAMITLSSAKTYLKAKVSEL